MQTEALRLRMPLCSVDFPTIVYLVRRKAVERSNWSKVCRLELAQVGQQRQLSVLIAALVFPATRPCQNQDFEDRILTPSHGLEHSRCSLPCNTLELWLDRKVGVAPGGVVVLCKLIQGRLRGRVSLVTLRRPQKLWREGGRLGDPTVVQLHHMWNWEKADHVHQQLKSKPCGWPEQQRLSLRLNLTLFHDVCWFLADLWPSPWCWW